MWNLTKVIDIIDGLISVDQSGWINIAPGCVHMVFGENINMEESKLSAQIPFSDAWTLSNFISGVRKRHF